MKKILCFMLALVLMFSLCMFSASAVEKEAILKDAFLALHSNTDWTAEDIVIYDYAEKDGVTYFSAEYKYEVPKPVLAWVVTMGDWCVGNVGARGRYGIILYVMIDGVAYPAETAWKNGLVTDFSPAKDFGGVLAVERIGDADADGVLNIKDATWIQKKIAGFDLSVRPNDTAYSCMIGDIHDFNRDGERNIKDATAIQKHIAGLEY